MLRPFSFAATAAALLLTSQARAEAPKVVADIAAVHSLVSLVMGDVGTPDLILPPGASPHGYALRPSDARALQNADAVFWIGEGLTPWLEGVIDTLGEDLHALELSTVEGTVVYPYRGGALFIASGDHDDHGDHDNHKEHDDHDGHKGHDGEEEAHDDHHEGHEDRHDDHAEEHSGDHHDAHNDHDHHDHDGADPHSWLDPINAQVWVKAIAQTLSDLNPENAAIYAQNAHDATAQLQALTLSIKTQFATHDAPRFVVFHDAYQYFEKRFGFEALGAISEGDASRPSPVRVKELQTLISEQGAACIFAEPQFNPGLVAAVQSGTELKALVIDPQGADIEQGPGFYEALLTNMSSVLLACAQD